MKWQETIRGSPVLGITRTIVILDFRFQVESRREPLIPMFSESSAAPTAPEECEYRWLWRGTEFPAPSPKPKFEQYAISYTRHKSYVV